MTAWKHAHLCLIVLLCLINLSKEGCEDYFTVERMTKYLNHTVYLIETGELKDTLECTVERECINRHKPYCLWLDHCYDRRDVSLTTETEKCKGNPSVGISHYHFGCLVSHYTLSKPVEGCKNYERVCELHKERHPIISEETKPSQRPPPPTTTTTTTTTKATLPETTTAAPATPPDTTRATTAAAPTTRLSDTTRATTTTATTTTALSPTVTQSAVSGNNANNSKIVAGNDNTNTDPLKIFLGISVIFNVMAVLGGLYMHRRWTQDSQQRGNTLVLQLEGYPTEVPLATELRSETPPSCANREEENIQLMTPQDCQSIITHSADRDSHCCAAGEEKHL